MQSAREYTVRVRPKSSNVYRSADHREHSIGWHDNPTYRLRAIKEG